ncbi:MAG TPA: signal peptidase I [Mycobacteriales bacterium]|jgi:signal peptidase
MATVVSATRRVAGVALLLAAAAALLLSVAARTGTVRVSRVLTGSMAPTVPAGAAVLSRPADAGSLAVGDVVMFVPPAPYGAPGGAPVVHRVVAVERADGEVLVRTKGDANDGADPWLLNASRSTVHDVAWSSATAGRLADLVARGGGSLLLSAVVAAVALRMLVLLWRPAAPGRHRTA